MSDPIPGQIWYDPQALLQSAPSASDGVKSFWLDGVGYQLGRQLYNKSDVAAMSQPQYADMTQANVESLGISVIFNQWMFEYFYQQVKSGAL